MPRAWPAGEFRLRWRGSSLLPAVLACVMLLGLLAGCGGGGGGGSGGGGASGPKDPSLEQNLPPVVIPALPPGAPSERFFVIGDQGTGKPGQFMVAQAMGLYAMANGVDFVLTTGDNIYPAGVSSPNDPDWLSKFETPYSAPVLLVPFYASLGNHDHLGSVSAAVDYTSHSDQWTMSAPYATFTRTLGDGTDVQFFTLDTDPIAQGGGSAAAQLAWLQDALAASTARWKFAYGHHPIHSYGKHGDTKKMIEQVLPLLSAGGVDVYFCGHDHSMQLLDEPGGPLLVVSGAASGVENATPVKYGANTVYASTGGGFVSARVSQDQLLLEFVRLDGLTQFVATLDK